MRCIICGHDTGDGCVPLCEEHMGIAELTSRVELADLSDWEGDELASCLASHIEYMCGEAEAFDPTAWPDQITAILARA